VPCHIWTLLWQRFIYLQNAYKARFYGPLISKQLKPLTAMLTRYIQMFHLLLILNVTTVLFFTQLAKNIREKTQKKQ